MAAVPVGDVVDEPAECLAEFGVVLGVEHERVPEEVDAKAGRHPLRGARGDGEKGRNKSYEAKHYVVIVQHGNRLTAQSLPGASSNPDSPLTLDLTVDRNVVTGTWVEQTAVDGYYNGARYHGAVQLLVEPTGRRMAGKWVGFGKDFDVNTGPWELRLVDGSTSKATLERYSASPE